MRGYLRTFSLFLVFIGLFVAVGYLIALYMGAPPQATMAIFLVIAMVLNVAMYFWSDKIVLRSYRAKIVEPHDAPRLHTIVDKLVLRSGMPKPRVAIIPMMTPNAFATGRNPDHAVVAATTGILQLLDDDELEGVLAHELSHVKNRDTLIMTVAAVLASAISFAAYAAIFTRSRDGNPLIGILIFLTAPLAATLLRLALSRNREFAADATGANICGKPEALARALQKLEHGSNARPMQGTNPSTASLFIVNPLRGGGARKLFSTHPPTQERVERLTGRR
jgi:heat shock protein HtpX